MAEPTKPAAPSEELGKLLASLGINAQTAAGGFDDNDDFPVLVGKRTRAVNQPVAGRPVSPGQLRMVENESPSEVLDTKNKSEMLADFYRLTPAKLRQLQRRLYNGGFYGDADEDTIRFGDYDADTLNAYEEAVTRAGANFSAGVHKTVDQVIDEAGVLGPPTTSRKRQPLVVALPNADDLRKTVELSARKVLGRKVGGGLVDSIIASLQEQALKAQQAEYMADETGGVVVAPPSPEVFAEQQIRANDPAAAGAHDAAVGLYDDFLKIWERRAHSA